MSMETESGKVEKKVLQGAREYCRENGLKLTWFISRAIEEKVRNGRKRNESLQ